MKKQNKKTVIWGNIDCGKCTHFGSCCRFGVEVDLEEAKKILRLGLPAHLNGLEVANDKKRFPSGYKVDTSIGDTPCEFLCPDGKCAIHKIDPDLKPTVCKEFPDWNSPAHYQFCVMMEKKEKTRKNKSRGILD